MGDHLGSATLLVDTSAPPQVAQRQYYTPYGEQAFQYTANSSLTSVNFTGQRLDTGSGLLYYGARYYDPQLSYFLAADTIAPDHGKPQSGDRYSYVLNNPLRYSDPTGHNAADFQECESKKNKAACEADFKDLDIELEHQAGFDWTIDELMAVLRAVHDLMSTAEWSYTDFKEAMGSAEGRTTVITKRHAPNFVEWLGGAQGTAGFEYYSGDCWTCTNKNLVVLYDNAFSDPTFGWLKQVTVHELAHAWDSRHHDQLSLQMMNETDGFVYPDYHRGAIYVNGETSLNSNAAKNPVEDFAETVAAEVYPTHFNAAIIAANVKHHESVQSMFVNP